MPPTPFSPWQAAPFSTKTSVPWATVPLPCGRPLPSGRTSMSHSAISFGVAVRPKSEAAAEEISANAIAPESCAILRQDILDPSRLVDAPGLLRVVMKQGVRPHRRDEGVSIRLHVALLVYGAAD